MIETEQTVAIRAGIDSVWAFARDIRGWAGLMPGMQDCEVIDDDNSRWVLKVGVGGLVRTVKVRVHVEQWDGPERVFFNYKLEGDPVQGGGSYHATAIGPGETEVRLNVRVEAIDETGASRVIEATGWYARILQHEIDHLRGIVCCDRMDARTLATAENHGRFAR